jgi:hypothetical protein
MKGSKHRYWSLGKQFKEIPNFLGGRFKIERPEPWRLQFDDDVPFGSLATLQHKMLSPWGAAITMLNEEGLHPGGFPTWWKQAEREAQKEDEDFSPLERIAWMLAETGAGVAPFGSQRIMEGGNPLYWVVPASPSKGMNLNSGREALVRAYMDRDNRRAQEIIQALKDRGDYTSRQIYNEVRRAQREVFGGTP